MFRRGLLLAVALAVLATSTKADQYQITLLPVLLPWGPVADSNSTAVQGGSSVAELNLAHVYIGPCAYRMMHTHATADELLVVVKGQLQSVLVGPDNTVYNHTLVAKTDSDNVVYPRGWMHFQYNPTCKQVHSVLAFNAKATNTVHVPFSLAVATEPYLKATYGLVPKPKGIWVVDPACAKTCNIKL